MSVILSPCRQGFAILDLRFPIPHLSATGEQIANRQSKIKN